MIGVEGWFDPWPQPVPAVVNEVALRLNNRRVGFCNHIDEPVDHQGHIFWFGRWPDVLYCALCIAPLAGNLRVANAVAAVASINLNHCDHCQSTRTPSHRKHLRAGNLLLVIEICHNCLGIEAVK